MEPDDGLEDDGPFFAWLPPDDRLWRHPSEIEPPEAAPDAAPAGAPAGAVDNPAGAADGDDEARGSGGRLWAVALVAGIVGALTASGLGIVSGAFEQRTTVVRSVVSDSPAPSLANDVGASGDWTSVDDSVAPSVVAVNVSSASGPVQGSGVVFMPGAGESYVVTEGSLIANGGYIHVTFQSGEQYAARLVGSDSLTGLAVIAVPGQGHIRPILGSVADLQLASSVLAVGARGASGGSVFPGTVSAEDREVDLTGGSSMQDMLAVSGTQISAPAAGGPLVDDQGRVIGVTVDVQPTSATDQAFTYAVPIDVAQHVVSQMIDGTTVTHPWLGVTDAQDLPVAVAQQLNLTGGATVGSVWPGSPAGKVGLSANDIITGFDGQPVTSTGALTQLLSGCQPGRVAPIKYIHDGRPVTATLVVSNQPWGD